jgi:hypothetical protein
MLVAVLLLPLTIPFDFLTFKLLGGWVGKRCIKLLFEQALAARGLPIA